MKDASSIQIVGRTRFRVTWQMKWQCRCCDSLKTNLLASLPGLAGSLKVVTQRNSIQIPRMLLAFTFLELFPGILFMEIYETHDEYHSYLCNQTSLLVPTIGLSLVIQLTHQNYHLMTFVWFQKPNPLSKDKDVSLLSKVRRTCYICEM